MNPTPWSPLPMPQSVNDVLSTLKHILIPWCISNQSRIGYFAALYYQITLAVRNAILQGRFQDAARMSIMDVNFATRYFTALNGFMAQDGTVSKTWNVAFTATENSDLIILQHLLLAMNAHINLDLGVAASVTCPTVSAMESFQGDFDMINTVLDSAVPAVIAELDTVSPVLQELAVLFLKYEVGFTDLLMEAARSVAFAFAMDLVTYPEQALQSIQNTDSSLVILSNDIVSPAGVFATMVGVIKSKEITDVVTIINALNPDSSTEDLSE